MAEVLTPYSLMITSPEGQCLYKYEFVHFEHNEHLLTGVLTAIQVLHSELFGDYSTNINLDNIKIMSIDVGKVYLYLMYQGANTQANYLLTEVLDIFCQNDIFTFFHKNGLGWDIKKTNMNTLNELMFNHYNTEFLNEYKEIDTPGLT